MKILIIGHARSGKDTAAEYLRDSFGITFESSSLAASRIFIYKALKEKYGYSNQKECFEDRMNHRKEWYDLICEYNKQDKLRLAKDILKDSDVYVGMRSKDEVTAARNQFLFDLIIWIEGGDRIEEEPSSSITVTKEDAHVIIYNDKRVDYMLEALDKIGIMISNSNTIERMANMFGDNFKNSHLKNK